MMKSREMVNHNKEEWEKETEFSRQIFPTRYSCCACSEVLLNGAIPSSSRAHFTQS
jgi:hypothetical protein